MGFKINTKQHEMTCIKSDGLYRHYHFANPRNSVYWFDIVTTPYYLYVTGDMGTWVFSHIKDMLHFFNKNEIDYTYWAEKLQFGSCHNEASVIYMEVDIKATLKNLNRELQEWKVYILEDEDSTEKKADIADIKEAYKDFARRIGELKSLIDDYSSCGSISELTYSFAIENSGLTDPSVGMIESPWDWESVRPYTKPTYQFTWVCEAIQYASQRILIKELADKTMNKFLAINIK
ncbi:hypothetical protein O9375_13100 [Proteus mirabilis]|uniref:hypothetical protein n=1 Tax=Proteus mirabilis TaxID=584 RepID=UPI00257896CB|nr:hypothetical protein [Proteus mirabilis]MDM3728996.1 hypothetical protein [Proteus mirabilis]